MRRYFAVVALLIAVAVPSVAAAEWFSAGVQTNPAANAILFDTGPYNRTGGAEFVVTCTSTVLAFVDIEYRNAANTANLRDQHIATSGDTTQIRIPIDFNPGERVRGRLAVGITGNVQCSVHGPLSS